MIITINCGRKCAEAGTSRSSMYMRCPYKRELGLELVLVHKYIYFWTGTPRCGKALILVFLFKKRSFGLTISHILKLVQSSMPGKEVWGRCCLCTVAMKQTYIGEWYHFVVVQFDAIKYSTNYSCFSNSPFLSNFTFSAVNALASLSFRMSRSH